MEMNKHDSPDEEKVDRISNLPEAIRNDIVSFLPMVDAIRTSVLSKSWRNVCSSLSNLNFDQQLFEEMSNKKTCFKDCVNQLIECRDGSNVHSFRLAVDDSIVPHIHSWISYVVKHNVEKLQLCCKRPGTGNIASLPCSLFTSTTLTVLFLSDIHLELPTVVVFPILKTLDIRRVHWRDVEETNRLISSCPYLERLVLVNCSWNKFNLLIVSAPNLKRLLYKIALIEQVQEVNISSTSLLECVYIGHPPDISLECLSSLLIAKLFCAPHSGFKESPNVMNDCVIKILMGLQNVVKLMQGNFDLEILSRAQKLFSKNQIVLSSVKELGLSVFTTENQVQFVAFLLTIFPNLQTLRIEFNEPGRFARLLNMEAHHQPQNSSDMRALDHIAIRGIKGNDNELYLVRHLLENAGLLVDMKIYYSKDLDEDESLRNVIGDKIKNFVKASPNAMIAFV